MKEQYHNVNPLIRIKENGLLSSETFSQLIEADGFDRISEILQPTIYGQYLKINYQFEFEDLLKQEQQQLYQELIDLVPEPEVVWSFTMRYTFHNLKLLTKAEQMKQDLDRLFIFDGFYSKEEIRTAIQNEISARLPQEILTTIREVNHYLGETSILQGIDVIYDRHYLKEQRTLAERLGYTELLEATVRAIDFTNIIIAARCILQERSAGFMSTVLSDYGSIEKESFLNLAESSLEDYLTFLKATSYEEELLPALQENKIDFLKLDLIKDNDPTFLYQKAATTAFGPLPLLAFINAKKVEMMNLRMIIIGKRSGFSVSQVKERMRTVIDL